MDGSFLLRIDLIFGIEPEYWILQLLLQEPHCMIFLWNTGGDHVTFCSLDFTGHQAE